MYATWRRRDFAIETWNETHCPESLASLHVCCWTDLRWEVDDFRIEWVLVIRTPPPNTPHTRDFYLAKKFLVVTIWTFQVVGYSLVLAIRHLDLKETDLIQRRTAPSIATLCHFSYRVGQNHKKSLRLTDVNSAAEENVGFSFFEPMKIIDKDFDSKFYDDDQSVRSTFPIPAMMNGTNKRVFLYLFMGDFLRTNDVANVLNESFRKIDLSRRNEQVFSTKPDEYFQRFIKFLFEKVFVDAQNDFHWSTKWTFELILFSISSIDPKHFSWFSTRSTN